MKPMAEDPLIKDQVSRFKDLGADTSFAQSLMMERKRFIKQSENVFDEADNEALDETLPDLNSEDLQQLRAQMKAAGKTQYGFQNLLETEDEKAEDQNDILRIIMMKFNSTAKSKTQSFFTQQIQVQPPEGLINIIGQDGSWAPSIPTWKTGKSNLQDMRL